MTSEEMETASMVQNQSEDSKDAETIEPGTSGVFLMDNGSSESHDDLFQMVTQLRLENDYLKDLFKDFKNLQLRDAGSTQQIEGSEQESEEVKHLQERLELLNKELSAEKQTRAAAEEALKHLRTVYTEADARAEELSSKLAAAHQKLNQEIKEREEKYSELDSKFSRLHKRAKQRIQEVQKEKDDLEARFREVNETSERASSQHLSLQQEVERTRHQANEALKAMDNERQQLRSTCNKLQGETEEMRRVLHQKELAVESLQQSLVDKERMLEDLRGLLRDADEKKQIALTELNAKHKKSTEKFETQLADAASDIAKTTAVISSLQAQLAEKESKIAEMDAASSGEAARLKAALDTVKGEVARLKSEHGKEKESWEAMYQALKVKLEVAESNCIHAEVEVARLKSQLEMEISSQVHKMMLKMLNWQLPKKRLQT